MIRGSKHGGFSLRLNNVGTLAGTCPLKHPTAGTFAGARKTRPIAAKVDILRLFLRDLPGNGEGI